MPGPTKMFLAESGKTPQVNTVTFTCRSCCPSVIVRVYFCFPFLVKTRLRRAWKICPHYNRSMKESGLDLTQGEGRVRASCALSSTDH